MRQLTLTNNNPKPYFLHSVRHRKLIYSKWRAMNKDVGGLLF